MKVRIRASSEERRAECMELLVFAAYGLGRVSDSPMCGHRVARPDRAGPARHVVAHREDEIELRSIGGRKHVPVLAAQSPGRQLGLLQCLQGERINAPIGALPALYAENLPAPKWLRRRSAKMLRAELPVHRNRTLYSGELINFTTPPPTGRPQPDRETHTGTVAGR